MAKKSKKADESATVVESKWSEWTDSGYRVMGRFDKTTGLITLSCQSENVVHRDGTLARSPWYLFNVTIFVGMRSEAERLAKHVLGFAGDADLVERGVSIFHELFASLPEHDVTAGGGQPGPGNVDVN